MKSPNVYGVSRDLWDHPLFADEPYTEKQAWAWLIGAAAWKVIQTRGNAGLVKLGRGEFSFSLRFLGEKFQWQKDRVARFISRLQKHDMLRDTSRDGCQIYYVCNYNNFQKVGLPERDSESDTSRDASATAPRQHRDKEETGETGKQENISPSRRSVAKPILEPAGFEAFYQTFPKHAGRRAAEKAYRGALKRATADALLEGARVYAASVVGREAQFVKHPATWLNGDHWLDELGPIAGENVVKLDWAAFNTAEEREAQERLRQGNG